ncbi:MAG TPA: TylF/MycF/NovP-related O-methyltransferase [Fimbriimonadaceae bacterium]|nr:TylF/MycF/NovP-related O-methyltransferase [Fimbriimonadaceae bacterium]
MASLVYNLELQLDNGNFLVNTQDGRQFIRPPYTYAADGYSTHHNASCLEEPRFVRAYARGIGSGHRFGDVDLRWRVHQYCWAAWHARQLEGCFVECGVNTGIFSLSVMNYIDFNSLDKDFYLFDTFAGPPDDQFTEGERQVGIDKVHEHSYPDCWEQAKLNFKPFKRAHLVRGRVPQSLSQVKIEKVCYLCIDMNAVVPEVAAFEHFWPKMVTGAIMILDDYGWLHHVNQKTALDELAERNGVKILNLPTGQGILIKP